MFSFYFNISDNMVNLNISSNFDYFIKNSSLTSSLITKTCFTSIAFIKEIIVICLIWFSLFYLSSKLMSIFDIDFYFCINLCL